MKKRKTMREKILVQQRHWKRLSLVNGIAAIVIIYISAARLSVSEFTFISLPAAAVLLLITFYSYKKINHLDRELNSIDGY